MRGGVVSWTMPRSPRASSRKKAVPKPKTGRPSSFRPEFAEQAFKLCLLGATDADLADFFHVSEQTVNAWKKAHPDFLGACTPSDEDRRAYAARKQARRERINVTKRRALASSPSRRVRNATSARVWAALKGRTDGRLFSRLGYSVEELMGHLATRFQPGMTWENYGRWHVDHIRPCAAFDQSDPMQFGECWALDNLQPLWASDNIRKGARCASA